jgi:hypothetical protein
MAPEQSDSKGLSQEADVSSFGVLILEAPSGCERRWTAEVFHVDLLQSKRRRCGDAARRARHTEALHGRRGADDPERGTII